MLKLHECARQAGCSLQGQRARLDIRATPVGCSSLGCRQVTAGRLTIQKPGKGLQTTAALGFWQSAFQELRTRINSWQGRPTYAGMRLINVGCQRKLLKQRFLGKILKPESIQNRWF